VSEKTKRRVEEIALRRNYVRDHFSSINARRRSDKNLSRLVGVHCHISKLKTPSLYEFYSTVYFGVADELRKRDYSAILIDAETDPLSLSKTAQQLGSLMILGPISSETKKRVMKIMKDKPILQVFNTSEEFSTLNPDDCAGGEIAAKRMLELGYEQALIVTTKEEINFQNRAQQFARSFGLDTQVVETSLFDSREDVKRFLVRYFSEQIFSKVQPKAIFATNGFLTHLVYEILSDKIPNEVSLIGFDFLPFYGLLDRKIDRIGFSAEQMGVVAAEELIRLYHSPQPLKHHIFPVEYLAGETALSIK
jgi:DNA-binding LacI/PurR family transcriptional regulator